jgi:hypothetical protein
VRQVALRVAFGAGVALALVFVLLGLRTLFEGTHQLKLSDEAWHRGDVWEATVHARRAAMAYVPGSSHVPLAQARLLAAAEGAEARGDRRMAQMAYRAMRAALMETRHPGAPRKTELARVAERLAALGAAEAGGTREERDLRFAEELSSLKEHGSTGWVALGLLMGLGVLLSLVAWLGVRRSPSASGA